ncbi:MAG: tetratricopeptide repeat protein [Planctomycetes bacterium]|nr:tetratricopeptide repeat protein [Planctomycetota bacterium]
MRDIRHILKILMLPAVLAAGCEGMKFSFIFPTAADTRYASAQNLVKEGKTGQAIAELSQAVKADPGHAPSWEAMGDIHRRQGRWDKACEEYQTCVKVDPYRFRPHYHLGLTYQTLADSAGRPEDRRKQLEQAINVYLRALVIQGDDFDTHLNLSYCYYSLGKYPLAEKHCQAALQIEPTNPKAHFNMGVLNEAQGRFDRAAISYANTVELDINNAQAMMAMAMLNIRQHHYKKAGIWLNKIVQFQPDNATAWGRLGLCHYRIGDHDKALAAFRSAANARPNDPDPHRGIGVVLMGKFLADPQRTDLRDEAIGAWNKSLELKPGQKDLIDLIDRYAPRPAPQ